MTAAILQSARGWLPAGDDAVITLRAWESWSLHPPLVGQPILGGSPGQTAHDSGPLLYWLLALPVHLDPTQGALWGAAVLCAAATSVAIIAVWSVRGWPAALGVLVVFGAVEFERPQMVIDPVWNPNIGLVFFIAASAVGWAVATGRFRFWPAQVLLASVAAQCHLMFLAAAVLAALIAPLVGMARTPRLSKKWLIPGLLVAVGCWLAPLVQQLTGPRGNFSALLALRSSGHRLGWTFGLRALMAVIIPSSAWFHGSGLGKVMLLMGSLGSWSAILGALAIVGLATGSVVMWVTQRRDAAALLALLATVAVSEVYTLASYTPNTVGRFIALGYIVPVMWPIGVGVLLTVAWGAGGAAVVWYRRSLRGDRRELPVARRLNPVPLIVAASLAAVLTSALVAHDERADPSIVSASSGFTRVRTVTHEVQHSLRRGRLKVVPAASETDELAEYNVLLGVLWRLYAAGYRPTTLSSYSLFVGPALVGTVSGPAPPTVAVSATGSHPAVISLSPTADASAVTRK